MTNFDKVCTDIIKEFPEYKDFAFEKKAEVVVKPKNTVKLPESVNFRKIASEIRKAVAPVEVSYADLNNFIGDLRS